MSIERVPIRATIVFGGVSVSTPYILSFNVTKTRNSKSTFSASVKILSYSLDNINDNSTKIYAGEKGNERLIFTGFILSSRPSICFDDPNYTVLNISGSDILYRLEGEKYTRRQMDSKAKWAIIDSVIRAAEKGSQFALVNENVQFNSPDISGYHETKNKSNNTADINSFGVSNLSSGALSLNFTFGAVTSLSKTEETPTDGGGNN
jgi:hypothetical protein